MGNNGRKKSIRYPWNNWLTRKHSFVLHRGKDFHCMTHSMAQQFRNEVRKRNKLNGINYYSVTIHIEEDTLVVMNNA